MFFEFLSVILLFVYFLYVLLLGKPYNKKTLPKNNVGKVLLVIKTSTKQPNKIVLN